MLFVCLFVVFVQILLIMRISYVESDQFDHIASQDMQY